MATMLESAAKAMATARNSSSLKDVLENAMPECKKCLQKLHSLPDVQRNFKVELDKGLLNVKGRFGKDERREIISAVCHVNRAIYDALQAAGEFTPLLDWPAVNTGEDKVDPLCDGRVAEVLKKVGLEQWCITPWSFRQMGGEEYELIFPWGVATNADGQFIITDKGDETVKVFDSSGHLILKFSPHIDDGERKLNYIWDVATDEDSNIYVLVSLEETGAKSDEYAVDHAVLVFNSTADQLRKFPVKMNWRLTVSKNKVLVAWNRGIDVYKTNGKYVRSFGDEILKDARDITAGPDGRILVPDWGDECIHVFTEDGEHLSKFSISTKGAKDSCVANCVACHPGSEHVIVAGWERETRRLRVAIYTKDGECQRTVTLEQTVTVKVNIGNVVRITVRMAGHIVVRFVDQDLKAKVIIF